MAMDDLQTSQRTPLIEKDDLPATDTESDDSPPGTLRNKHLLGADSKKYGHRKQLSLYSWLSNTPATSPSTAVRQTGGERGDSVRPTKLTIQSPPGKIFE